MQLIDLSCNALERGLCKIERGLAQEQSSRFMLNICLHMHVEHLKVPIGAHRQIHPAIYCTAVIYEGEPDALGLNVVGLEQ